MIQIPTSFEELQTTAANIWAASPLAVGMVVGMIAVALFKLLSVRKFISSPSSF